MSIDQINSEALECSLEAPWGIHPAVTDNVCPRCGWVARGEAARDPVHDQERGLAI